jgi:predicted permease
MSLMPEIRHAIKAMAAAPAFALGAALTFALGIGVNVAVFSAIDRVLFRPLPYDQPDRLFVMRQYRAVDTPDAGLPAAYVVRARLAPAIEELTLTGWSRFNFRFSADTEGVRYFGFVPMAYTALKTLGVRPVMGTDFTEADARQKRQQVMITYATWQREFGGRTDVVGRLVWGSSAGSIYEIAGVLPDDFIPPQLKASEAWSGIVMTWQILDATTTNSVFTPPIVRLKPEVSLTQAQAQIDAIVASVGPEFPAREGSPASFVRLEPLREVLFGRYATYVGLVFAGSILVLLVGCANLASLLALRARSREHRAAIQLALGASPLRLIRSSIIEALLFAAAGCAIALVAIDVSSDVMASWLPSTFTSYVAPVFGTRTILFAICLAAVSAVAAGMVPGWRLSRVGILTLLQRGTGRVGSARLGGIAPLLGFEVALSTVLVFAAVLTGRTLANLRDEDVGFQPDGLMTVAAYLPAASDQSELLRQYREMLEILRRTPGVQSVAGADTLPMIGAVNRPMFAGAMGTQRCPVTEGLVETLGMRVIAGRTISEKEVRESAAVGMLSLEGLKFIWPGVAPQNAIGRFLEFPGEAPREVVGVVSDVRHQHLAPVAPSLYVPVGSDKFSSMLFAVRVSSGSELTAVALARDFRSRGLAPKSVAVNIVADGFASSAANETFRARLFAGFGLVALVLAITGIYAVQSFAVSQRRTEFSVRVSLGATPRDLGRLVLLETVRPVTIGIVVGLVAAYWSAGLVQSFLYGFDARDPWTFLGVASLLVTAAGVAVWAPARRAARTEPMTALRMP